MATGTLRTAKKAPKQKTRGFMDDPRENTASINRAHITIIAGVGIFSLLICGVALASFFFIGKKNEVELVAKSEVVKAEKIEQQPVAVVLQEKKAVDQPTAKVVTPSVTTPQKGELSRREEEQIFIAERNYWLTVGKQKEKDEILRQSQLEEEARKKLPRNREGIDSRPPLLIQKPTARLHLQ